MESLAAELGELNEALEIVQLVASDVALKRQGMLDRRQVEIELDRELARFEHIATSRIEALEKAITVSEPRTATDILILLLLYRNEIHIDREELGAAIQKQIATLPAELGHFLMQTIDRHEDRTDYLLSNIIGGLQRAIGVSACMVGLEQYAYETELCSSPAGQ